MALTMLTDNRKDRQRLKQLRLRRKEQDKIIRIIKGAHQPKFAIGKDEKTIEMFIP